MAQEMYYLMVSAKPCAENPEAQECAGAYVNCFVKTDSPAEAECRVQQLLAEEGWEPLSIDTVSRVSRERYAEDPEMCECYDEAEKFGQSAIFYIWEKEE